MKSQKNYLKNPVFYLLLEKINLEIFQQILNHQQQYICSKLIFGLQIMNHQREIGKKVKDNCYLINLVQNRLIFKKMSQKLNQLQSPKSNKRLKLKNKKLSQRNLKVHHLAQTQVIPIQTIQAHSQKQALQILLAHLLPMMNPFPSKLKAGTNQLTPSWAINS